MKEIIWRPDPCFCVYELGLRFLLGTCENCLHSCSFPLKAWLASSGFCDFFQPKMTNTRENTAAIIASLLKWFICLRLQDLAVTKMKDWWLTADLLWGNERAGGMLLTRKVLIKGCTKCGEIKAWLNKVSFRSQLVFSSPSWNNTHLGTSKHLLYMYMCMCKYI